MKRQQASSITLVIPKWVGVLYVTLAVGLAPWIIYLAFTLPTHHRATNWDVVWTGFDIGLLLALFCTAIAAFRRSLYIIIAASATGTLLLVDAWFDLITEQSQPGFEQALVLALLVELPLAFMSFYLASHALRRNTQSGLPKSRR